MVEGSRIGAFEVNSKHPFCAGKHLSGSLVGKGSQEYIVEGYTFFNKVCQSKYQGSRLAASCTCQDQGWTICFKDHFFLLRIEMTLIIYFGREVGFKAQSIFFYFVHFSKR